MTKAKYMALADLQTVWTNSIKPWIVAGFIGMLASNHAEAKYLVLADGSRIAQTTFQAAGNYIVALGSSETGHDNLLLADGSNIAQSTFIPASEKGANSGVATLGADGKVPSSQLPSYVDDVLEGYLNATDGKFYEESTYTTEIPAEGGKIYVDLASNKTYRWGGSAYAEISASVALGETQGTAYEGSKGKANADAIAALQTSRANKVSGATNGNFAGLDSNGDLTDSGSKASDFATAAQGAKADSAIQTVKVNGTALTPDSNNAVNVEFEIPERVTSEELAAFVV